MKKLFLLLFSLCLVFAGSFAGSRWMREHQGEMRSLQLFEKKKGDLGFRPNPYPLENRFFTIVIHGKNNGASVEKTLSSVFSQTYENYRVIYIDDASNDGSFELARDLIYESGHLLQVTLVHNEESLGSVANLKRAVAACPDREIIVVLNGEDWLAHEWVLQRLNAYYADPDLWLTYGQYLDYPSFQRGHCKSVEAKKARREPFATSHLKTFYAALFKKIKEVDFTREDEMSYMFPLLEMGEGHSQFISEVLYVKNSESKTEDLGQNESFIRSLSSYQPLPRLVLNEVP